MRNYKAETDSLASAAAGNNLNAAIATLEENNKGDDKDLLYFFEKGALLHAKNDIPASTQAWLSADEKIKLWEEAVKTDPGKVMGQVGSFLVNDKTRRYDGYDYEKVMLSTLLAVNHTLTGNWENARTEIKKTHEREALIAEFRAKEYEKQEEEAKGKNIKTTYKELKGYPVETLDDPDVTALKNGYQSAFSHYLAGFVYEAMGEPSLAAPGYRKAIELRPAVGILEDGLSGVDGRPRKRKTGETDVLFIIEAGTAPARQSMAIPLPFFWRGGLNYTQVSFPVIKPDRSVFVPTELQVGKDRVAVSEITSIDAMSRRALRDDLPGIIVRTTIRAIAKGATQKELSKAGGWAGLAGGLLGAVATAVTEKADERVWRTLPARIAIGRAVLPAGQHTLTLPAPGGVQRFDITVAGKYAIVPLRIMGPTTYALQPDVTKLASASALGASHEPDADTASAAELKPAKQAGKKTRKKSK
ncbi:MAG: hypothetical protein RJA63_2978 [Pseudomonadota bacterium]|jgi:hypothetical protein